MSVSLKQIQALAKAGKMSDARQQLKFLLKTDPSADAWYLAATMTQDKDQQVKCLQRALKIDALHTPSNRLLHQLEGTPELQTNRRQAPPMPTPDLNRQDKIENVKQAKQQRRRRRGFGCLLYIIISSIITTTILSVAGMIPGTIGLALRLTSGVAPIYEVDNISIEENANSLFSISPAIQKVLEGQDIGFIDHGFVNEYAFEVQAGQSYVIYVQFLSLSATNVSDNVTVMVPTNVGGNAQCTPQTISEEYDNGAAYLCITDSPMIWKLRILGIEGESVGGYLVGIQTVNPG